MADVERRQSAALAYPLHRRSAGSRFKPQGQLAEQEIRESCRAHKLVWAGLPPSQ